MPRRPGTRGFSLLEVLVAVSILGMALTVILSAQAGLFAGAHRSAHIGQAAHLARCRMNETELTLLKDGYPLIDQNEEGPCCGDGSDDSTYRCAWKIETVELPEASLAGGDGGLGGGDDGLGALGALASVQQGTAPLDPSAGVAGLSGLLSAAAGSGTAGMAPLVMSLVYPDLKPMLEASIRKVTVEVRWREGVVERDLTIVQYVTNPMQGGLDPNAAKNLPPGEE